MGYFRTILQSRGLHRHDGRSLWKYSISEVEYFEIVDSVRYHLQMNDLIDHAEDAAVYVAEWWRRDYRGGKISWSGILERLGSQIDSSLTKAFEKACTKAISRLNLPIARLKNRHFLRTLLIQGGLPIQRIANETGNFTLYILALYRRVQRYGIDQVRNRICDGAELNYLPQTFRNETIQNIAFEIINALLKDDHGLLPFNLDNDLAKQFWQALKEGRSQNPVGFTGVHLQWILQLSENLTDENARIGLLTMVDNQITADSQKTLEIESARRLKVIVQGHDVASYRKTWGGDLILEYSPKKPIFEDAVEDVECYGVGDSQERVTLPVNGIIPNLDYPLLLEAREDLSGAKWFSILSKNTTRESKGFLFIPDGWNLSDSILPIRLVKGNNISGHLYSFEGQAELSSEFESRRYKTGINISEELVLHAKRLQGVQHSSLPIIVGEPKFKIYDETNNADWIDQDSIEWLDRIDRKWKPVNAHAILGQVLYRVKTQDSVHITKCFRVPESAEIGIIPTSALSGMIKIKGVRGTLASSIPCKISTKMDEVLLEYSLKSDETIPTKVTLTLDSPNNSGSVNFDIHAPFAGAYFMNAQYEVLTRNSVLCPAQLEGYRVVCVGDGYKLQIQGTNCGHYQPTNQVAIQSGERSIIDFIDLIIATLSLYSSLDQQNVVTLSISDQTSQEVTRIRIKRFNAYTSDKDGCLVPTVCVLDNDGGIIYNRIELKAFRLCGDFTDFQHVDLIWNDFEYAFPEGTSSGTWIVYSNYKTENTFKPCLRILAGDEISENEDTLRYAITIADSEHRKQVINDILAMDTDITSENWHCIVSYALFAMEHKIPLDVMDYYQVIFKSPLLSARLFLALQNSPILSDDIWLSTSMKIVHEQNFAWRLIPIRCWVDELTNMNDSSLPDMIKNLLNDRYFTFMQDLYQAYWDEIKPFIINPNRSVSDPGVIPKKWFDELAIRISLPERWPSWIPKLEEEWRNILPVEGYDRRKWGLLLAPVKAALIAAGYSTDYWNDSQGWKIRRICHYREIDRIWFDQVFTHVLKAIVHRKGLNS